MLSLALAVSGGAAVALIDCETVTLGTAQIHVRDVASPATISHAQWRRLGRLIIAAVPNDKSELTLSRVAVAGLISRRVPDVQVRPGSGTRPFAFSVDRAEKRSQPAGCHEMIVARRAGEPINAGDLVSASCASGQHAGVRRDTASRQLIAAIDLAAGTNVGRLAVTAAPAVRRGESLRLVSRVGPVEIERPVTAMQEARPARRVFVRDADGQVFAVRLDETEQAR